MVSYLSGPPVSWIPTVSSHTIGYANRHPSPPRDAKTEYEPLSGARPGGRMSYLSLLGSRELLDALALLTFRHVHAHQRPGMLDIERHDVGPHCGAFMS